jgi:hypothetical protein
MHWGRRRCRRVAIAIGMRFRFTGSKQVFEKI